MCVSSGTGVLLSGSNRGGSVPIGSDPRPGSDVAGYRLEELLGRGGMGAVYRAEDLRLGRKVALKLLISDLAENERFRERFLRESKIAASLDHAHIVPIYAAGEADGQLFLAMRFVEGYDLRTLIAREAPLQPRRALRLVEQVADALDAAHERGLIHRDVKPANVLIAERTGREHCYLADFGLTKQTSISGMTGTGELVGTVAYVSPEQIRGETIDGRADLYALGCLLYECLVGEAPFARDRDVARALAKAPSDRYGTCGELGDAARAALGASETDAAGTRPFRRAPRVRVRRRHLIAALGALALATAVAAAAVSLLRRDEPAVAVAPNSVAVIDPATNRVTAAVPVGAKPEAVAVGLGSAWVANVEERTLTRIDARTHATRTIALPATPTDVAVGFDAVWVAYGILGELARIDPQRNAVVKTFELGGRGARGSVAVDDERGVVWAAYGDATVARVRAATNSVVGSDFAGAPWAIGVGAGGAWLANWTESNVTRLDAQTGGPVTTIQVAKGPIDVAVCDGVAWVANEADDAVTQIVGFSPRTVDVGDRPSAVACGEDAVWVANRGSGTVSRIDPATREVTDTIEIGHAPVGIAVGADAVWVTVQAR